MAEVLSSEVVVIGGGVIGAATAYYLCKEGAEVMIVEAEDLASGASGACDGFISLQTKQLGSHLDLARESAQLFPAIAEDLEVDIEYNRCGGLMLARNAEQLKEIRARAKKLKAAGLQVEVLTPSDLKERLPDVSKDIKDYAYRVRLNLPYDQAVDKVTAALKEEGFGVLTEIDVKATLKKKLDADFRNYVILGACNPPLAYQALQAVPAIGLLLPCNVIVREEGPDRVVVGFLDPQIMVGLVDQPDVKVVADAAEQRLRRACASLGGSAPDPMPRS